MKRHAYTVMELLFILFVIAVLIGVLVPATLSYRENSRSNICQNNLRHFGIGFAIFGERDAGKRFCTNAFDLKRDGCPDTNSWVGNLMALGAATPGSMLCPVNSVRGIESLNPLIGNPATGNVVTNTLEGVKISQINQGFCKNFVITIDHTQIDHATPDMPFPNPAGTLGNGSPGRLLVVQKAVNDGYNTNYSQSWFMARQDFRYEKNTTNANILQTRGNQRDQSGAQAGIKVRFVEKAQIASSAIPFLGDAAPGNIAEATLTDTLSYELKKGDILGKSFGNGPSFINTPGIAAMVPPPIEILSAWTTENVSVASWGVAPAIVSPCPIPISAKATNGFPMTAFLDDTLPLPDEETFGGVDIVIGGMSDGITNPNIHGEINGYGGQDGILVLQDTRNFRAVHGIGFTRSCNILFADSAVKSLHDPNGDGFINPGFPVTNTAKPGEAERQALRGVTGYENNQCESQPAEFFNGPVLDLSVFKKAVCFE